MKLKMLKSPLQMARGRLDTLQPLRTNTVERKRGSAGMRDRERIRERDCGLCQECRRQGRVSLGGPVDHIVPLWRGGSDEEFNKELLCDSCHLAKSASEARERVCG